MGKENLRNFGLLVIFYLVILFLPCRAQFEFTGDLSVVSTYVWRGVKANNGPALQSCAALGYNAFKMGFWGSSIDFGDNQEVETDLFAEIALATGEIALTLGTTVYMFDFRTFNETSDAEVELYIQAGYEDFGLGIYYVPKQNSTRPYLNSANYWLELSGRTNLAGADLSGVLGYGTYSNRWLPDGDRKEAAALLILTAGKTVADQISVYWTYSLDLDSGFENIFYFGGSYSL